MSKKRRRRNIHVNIVYPREWLEDMQRVLARSLEDKEMCSEFPHTVIADAFTLQTKLKAMGKESIKLNYSESQQFIFCAYQYLKDKMGITTRKYVI